MKIRLKDLGGRLRHLILRLNRDYGMTVLLSSHQLAEVELLCSRGAILNQGRLIFQGRWSDLASANKRYRLEVDDWAKTEAVLKRYDAPLADGVMELKPGSESADIVRALVEAGVRVSAVEPIRQSLEEIYLGAISKTA